jgi:hypothetical protein
MKTLKHLPMQETGGKKMKSFLSRKVRLALDDRFR